MQHTHTHSLFSIFLYFLKHDKNVFCFLESMHEIVLEFGRMQLKHLG
jgi:hypothetical protein